jgi:hypothetical protein
MSKDIPNQNAGRAEVEAVLQEANVATRKDNAASVKSCISRFRQNVTTTKALLKRKQAQLDLVMADFDAAEDIDDMQAITVKWNSVSVVS